MDRQSDAAKAWCKANGHELNESLRLDDAGISAFKNAHLNGALWKFLRLAELGDLGDDPILLVEAIDRLSRLEAVRCAVHSGVGRRWSQESQCATKQSD